MSEAFTVTVKLDDESKALLKSVAAALAKGEKAAPAAKATKPAKAKPAPKAEAEAEDDDLDFGDEAEEEEAEEEEADEAEADEADAEEAGDDEGPTLDQVGEAMKMFATAPGGSKANAMKILKVKGKVDKLTALKPANFQAVIDTCKAETKKLKAKAK
jgi:hypothetical protein